MKLDEMSLLWSFDDDGGFTVADEATGFSCYAFPSSQHAHDARRSPRNVARKMMRAESAFRATGAIERIWPKRGREALAAQDARRLATLRARLNAMLPPTETA